MVARDLWQRKPTSPSGLRPRALWVYCHKSLQPWYNYYLSAYIYTGLSVEYIKENTHVTDEQLDTAVEEADLPELAACFDNTEDYVEKLQLSPGQQTDVRTHTFMNGTQAGMKAALKYWRNRNPVEATFRALLLILLSLLKGDVAVRVCKYLSHKCEQSTKCPLSSFSCKTLSIATFHEEVVKLRV